MNFGTYPFHFKINCDGSGCGGEFEWLGCQDNYGTINAVVNTGLFSTTIELYKRKIILKMSSRLISETHHNDIGIELVIYGDEFKICLASNYIVKSFIQAAFILCGLIAFVIHGLWEGYLLAMNRGLAFFCCFILLLAALIPLFSNVARYRQVGSYIISYNKVTGLFNGNYFKEIRAEEVDYFSIISENKGEVIPYEIQIVLKKCEKGLMRRLLVYPASVRLDSGKMYRIFAEFSGLVGKPLIKE